MQAQPRWGLGQGPTAPGPAHSCPGSWPADGCGQLSCVCSLTSTRLWSSPPAGMEQLEGVKLSPRSFHPLGDWEGVTTLPAQD